MKNLIIVLFFFCSMNLLAIKLSLKEQEQFAASIPQNLNEDFNGMPNNTLDNIEVNGQMAHSGNELFAAVFKKDSLKISQLVANGVSVDSRDERGNTPLNILCSCYIEIDNPTRLFLIHHLINLGANINATNAVGDTPLITALELQTAVAPLLLELGADTRILNNRNTTATDIVSKMRVRYSNYPASDFLNSVGQVIALLEKRTLQKLL